MQTPVNNCKITVINPSADTRLNFDHITYIVNKRFFCSDDIPILNKTIFKSKFTVETSTDHLTIKLDLNLEDIFSIENAKTPIQIEHEESFAKPKVTLSTDYPSVFALTTQLYYERRPLYIYVLFEPLKRANRDAEIYKLSRQKDSFRFPAYFISEGKKCKINPRNFKAIERTL